MTMTSIDLAEEDHDQWVLLLRLLTIPRWVDEAAAIAAAEAADFTLKTTLLGDLVGTYRSTSGGIVLRYDGHPERPWQWRAINWRCLDGTCLHRKTEI